MIKLIVLDIGGTLLSDDNVVSGEDISVLQSLKDKGIHVALATARMYSSTRYISNVIKSEYGIFSNGSFIYDTKYNVIILENVMDVNAILELLHFAQENKLYVHLNQRFSEGSDQREFFTLKHLNENKNLVGELKNNIYVVDDLVEYVKSVNDIIKVAYVSEKDMDDVYERLQEILRKHNLYITEFYRNLNETSINKLIHYIE